VVVWRPAPISADPWQAIGQTSSCRRAAFRRNHSPAHPAGNFDDVTELKIAIDEWFDHRNQNPKPFKWTATAKFILAKHIGAKKALAIARA
jgi:hypothetical protein